MLSKGNLIVISAPSGAGKTTLREELRKLMPDLEYSVSMTTRSPRGQETDGKDYHFVSKEAFRDGIGKNKFVEWAEVHDNLYGTPREFIENKLAEGKDVLLDIDVQGAMEIRKQFPSALLIFVCAPSMAVLEKRLRDRRSDSAEEVRKRLITAAKEMTCSEHYDHIITNENLKQALAELEGIVKLYRESKKGVEKKSGCSN
jgi:guanylate kinase